MPFFYVTNARRGKQLILLLIITFFTALFFYVEFLAVSPSFSINGKPKIIYKGEKGVALTFNIGWGDEKAEDILKALKQEKIHAATFFLAGSWVERHPHIVKMIKEQGYEIGLLGYSYIDYTELEEPGIQNDISKGLEAFRKAGIEKPLLLRTPTGDVDRRVLKIAEKSNLTMVHWSVNSMDWKNPGTKIIAQNVAQAKKGDIILLHASDAAIQTAKAIPLIKEELTNKNLKLLSVSEMISNSKSTSHEISRIPYMVNSSHLMIRETLQLN
ncbi:polysaccharide deacetylase family protein [Pradoshia sp. D12]|uniref:polysaccharide deacetylase family protein n=1 Tax=Bacillaceae TaxID=186817 RepID=UPI00112DA3AC|nr:MULTISPECIES: polysaccharide deacetylase family protein [Bacillaceae]QFK69935.1 polysaccharide deacetylase family protein [Pradoshia sp. D12]TPF70354.1 polysaccharide deacetylase family sporulation protein PdaB [Bacillus sp. D12]